MFAILIGLIALLVASCAAFFSVQGLATLYSGQFLAVCIMASSLEISKLIATSYLHRYWSKTATLLRTYLVIAVVILMGITSLGIFGFLTSAYHKSHAIVELVDSKQETLTNQRSFLETEIKSLNDRVSTLNSARESQEKRLPSMSSKSAKPIYEDIQLAGKEIQNIREKISILTEDLKQTNENIIELKGKKSEVGDIGTLQFVADVLNLKIDDVVLWFTLSIVLVFDPMAVGLVLAYNNIITNKKVEPEPEEVSLEPLEEQETHTTTEVVSLENDAKYRD
jgi:hypothetical protein